MVDHGAHKIELLHVLGVIRGVQTFSQLLVDDGQRLIPIFVLNMIDDHVVAELSNVQRTEADIRKVRTLTSVTVHGVDRRNKLACRETTIHFLFTISVYVWFLCSIFTALSVLGHLLLRQDMMIPRPRDIFERLIVFAQVHLENTTIEVHVFKLEDVLSIVASPVDGRECLLLASRQVRKL